MKTTDYVSVFLFCQTVQAGPYFLKPWDENFQSATNKLKATE